MQSEIIFPTAPLEDPYIPQDPLFHTRLLRLLDLSSPIGDDDVLEFEIPGGTYQISFFDLNYQSHLEVEFALFNARGPKMSH